jgi:hypothetical protein
MTRYPCFGGSAGISSIIEIPYPDVGCTGKICVDGGFEVVGTYKARTALMFINQYHHITGIEHGV